MSNIAVHSPGDQLNCVDVQLLLSPPPPPLPFPLMLARVTGLGLGWQHFWSSDIVIILGIVHTILCLFISGSPPLLPLPSLPPSLLPSPPPSTNPLPPNPLLLSLEMHINEEHSVVLGSNTKNSIIDDNDGDDEPSMLDTLTSEQLARRPSFK